MINSFFSRSLAPSFVVIVHAQVVLSISFFLLVLFFLAARLNRSILFLDLILLSLFVFPFRHRLHHHHHRHKRSC